MTMAGFRDLIAWLEEFEPLDAPRIRTSAVELLQAKVKLWVNAGGASSHLLLPVAPHWTRAIAIRLQDGVGYWLGEKELGLDWACCFIHVECV